MGRLNKENPGVKELQLKTKETSKSVMNRIKPFICTSKNKTKNKSGKHCLPSGCGSVVGHPSGNLQLLSFWHHPTCQVWSQPYCSGNLEMVLDH